MGIGIAQVLVGIAQLVFGIAQLLSLMSDEVVILTGYSLDLFLSFNSCIGRSNRDLRDTKPMVSRGCVLKKEEREGRGGVGIMPGCGPALVGRHNPRSLQYVCMYAICHAALNRCTVCMYIFVCTYGPFHMATRNRFGAFTCALKLVSKRFETGLKPV